MKKIKGSVGMIAVIVIIVAIAAGVIGYLLAKKTQSPIPSPVVQKQNNPVVNNNAVQKPTVDIANSYDTTNWKVYTNTKYGYSFKYPQARWFVYGDIDDAKNSDSVSISVVDAQDRSCLIEVSTDNLQSKIRDTENMLKVNLDYKKLDVIFLGNNATQMTYSTEDEGKKISDGKSIIFSKGGYTYYLDGSVMDYEKTDGVDKGIFNAILSTFQFAK